MSHEAALRSLGPSGRPTEFFTGLDEGIDESVICPLDDMVAVTVVIDPDATKLALEPYLGRLLR